MQPASAQGGAVHRAGGPTPQQHHPAALDDEEDSEEEPDIDMSSFMSGDPNFNRETSDSQSMTKALGTLKIYLSDYSKMKEFRPAMLVFLHSLLARKEAKWYKPLTIVFFDWLADDWHRAGFPPKQSKRAAFALYSTFLNREGPLALEACLRTLDPGLDLGQRQQQPNLADSIRALSELFARRPMDSYLERISAQLAAAQAQLLPMLEALAASVNREVVAKRRDGFVSDILPGVDGLRPDQSDERQQRFIDQSRPIVLSHLSFLIKAPFGGSLEAGCLATLMERLFQLRLRSELPADLPLLNGVRAGKSSLGGQFKELERRGTHLLRPAELDRILACAACGKLLCGPPPQAMRCKVGDCHVVCHRACLDLVKPIGCSSAAGLISRSHSGGARDSGAHAYQSKESTDRSSGKGSGASPKSSGAGADPAAGAAASLTPHQPQSASLPQLQGQAGPPPQILVDPAAAGQAQHRGSIGSVGGHDLAAGGPPLSPYELDQDSLLDMAGGHQENPVVEHPDVGGVPSDFQSYIQELRLSQRLAQLARGGEKEAERFKEYQLALHEVAFSSMSHLRALTLLQLLFVQSWPKARIHVLQQLGLHFVPDCIDLYHSLMACLRGDNMQDLERSGQLDKFGARLLDWYMDEANALNFQRLGLSFGFAKTNSRRKTASINEDDIILRLMLLRREDATFNLFFVRAEAHPAMNKRRFVDLYSVNMQQTMRMVTLLDTAARKARKAKDSCDFAEKDAENLERCVAKAKAISDYCNSTGAKLKELSRQLVLSKSYANFWDRSNMDEIRIGRFKGQISHLHTCQLHLTREVLMPGLEGYRLRLFVFDDFLLVIYETDEARGVKYQLLKQLGPSVSVDSQKQQQQQQQQPQSTEMANLIEATCPPVIPMDSVLHIFDTASEARHRLPGSRAVDAEFRVIVEQPIQGGRVKQLLLEFRMCQEKPRQAFFVNENQRQASDFVECIRSLAPKLSGQQRLDRNMSLSVSGSAADLSTPGAGRLGLQGRGAAVGGVGQLAQQEHRRVHSSVGVSGARPAALLAASGSLATSAEGRPVPPPRRRAVDTPGTATDESEGEPTVGGDDSASPESAVSESASQAKSDPAVSMVESCKLLGRMEALLKEQEATLPQALGVSCLQEATALAQSDHRPSRAEKILLAWQLMAATHRALAGALPALIDSSEAASQAALESSMRQLSGVARATADCIDRQTRPVVERRKASIDSESKFRLSRVSEVSSDSQTQPPQDSLMVERRAQLTTTSAASAVTAPTRPPPPKPPKPPKSPQPPPTTTPPMQPPTQPQLPQDGAKKSTADDGRHDGDSSSDSDSTTESTETDDEDYTEEDDDEDGSSTDGSGGEKAVTQPPPPPPQQQQQPGAGKSSTIATTTTITTTASNSSSSRDSVV